MGNQLEKRTMSKADFIGGPMAFQNRVKTISRLRAKERLAELLAEFDEHKRKGTLPDMTSRAFLSALLTQEVPCMIDLYRRAVEWRDAPVSDLYTQISSKDLVATGLERHEWPSTRIGEFIALKADGMGKGERIIHHIATKHPMTLLYGCVETWADPSDEVPAELGRTETSLEMYHWN